MSELSASVFAGPNLLAPEATFVDFPPRTVVRNRGNVKGAAYDTSERYRYLLMRVLAGVDRAGLVTFLMLNPSTADEVVDDPTIRRCMDYAIQWRYAALEIVNLYAFRSPYPKSLRAALDPVGEHNDWFIRYSTSRAQLVVCAWGSERFAIERAANVVGMLRQEGVRPHALQTTKGGHPSHPLYLRRELRPQPYEVNS